MATPTYRIYYGKYPDQLTNEIENTDIMQVDGLQFRMEPGKPGEPVVDEVSFTLKNLDHTGSEIYPRSWFEDAARSEAEGAIVPLQLFFRVEMPDYGDRGFTGVLRNKKYSKYRSEVTVTIKDPTDLVKEGDVFMLKPFTFEECRHGDGTIFGLGSAVTSPNAVTDIPIPFDDFNPDGFDLDDNAIQAERLFFRLSTTNVTLDDPAGIFFDHHYYHEHTDINQKIAIRAPDWTENTADNSNVSDYEIIDTTQGTRSAFIKIGENTILTKINEYVIAFREFVATDIYNYWARHYIEIVHADNGNIVDDVIQRGRFFADDDLNDLQHGESYDITIYDYNLGFDDDILVDESDGPFSNATPPTFYHGCEVEEDFPSSGEYTIRQTSGSFFDTLTTVTHVFEQRLYGVYYDAPASVDLFDISRVPDYANRYAFWADLMLYGWLDTEPTEILINLAMQLNCYLYFNAAGKIVFHSRDYHEDYLPGSLPPGAFEVQLGDIEPLGDYEEDHGFDTFKIEVADRIEINNVASDEARTVHVDEQGVRNSASLRSSSLEIHNYRYSDLGVPNINSAVRYPVLRLSPDDPNFTGTANVDELADFLPTAVQQAQRFAASWSYPTVLWKIQWDMPKYPQADIGGYFWVQWPDETRVYLIRDITHDPDQMLHKMEVQEVGVYNG